MVYGFGCTEADQTHSSSVICRIKEVDIEQCRETPHRCSLRALLYRITTYVVSYST